ncbi:MAG TPA: hypothetical protein VMR06_01580 [Dokdonella sp.]|nr:hypothetical protein [Dokdonella sp.]
MFKRMFDHARRTWITAASVLALASIAVATSPASAEGTRSLHPSGAVGNRGVMDVSDSTNFASVARGRQFLYVYARAGEYILLGSRNRANGGDIFVYDPQSFGTPGDETIPATANFTCSTQSGGLIASRDEELAGPNSADGSATMPNGFTPCWYVAPTTGVYGVRFTGATSGGQTNTASIATPPILSGSLVSAWDVTVRASADSLDDLDGRLFTYAWTVYLQNNGRTLHNDLYYVSTDGYRYRQTFRGLDPNRAAFYANARGYIDTNGGPLYRDIRGSNAAVSAGPSLSAGISAQRPQYPIFFSDITPGGANAAEVNRVLTALAIPLVPAVPQLTNPVFIGNVGGSTSTVSAGGVFAFSTQNTLTYEIVVSRDGIDFDPANVLNRVLTGTALTGNHTVLWDGLDNNGLPFPAGDYQFRIVGRNGEIHFPMIDVEGNSGGGPTLTKLNGSQDSTVYYDDRGYRAANGTLIGELNGHLCGAGSAILQPVPSYSLIGVDSANANFNGSGNYYRSWGGSNDSNADCTNAASQYFATAKGLDLWALERSPTYQEPIEIVEPTDGVDVGTMVSVTSSVLPGESAFGNFVFTNAGDVTATGVTYAATLGDPGVPATCPAAVVFSMVPPGVTATYQPAPLCSITFTGMPTTLTPGQSLNFNFNYVVAVSNPGPIPITTVIAAANETPGAPAPNTATAQTVVARPVIGVVKSSTPAPGSEVEVGDTITYTLSTTIANAPLTSTLTLDDLLGPGLTFGSVTGSHPSFICSGALVCTLPPGTAIGTYTVTYTATVDASAVGSVANNVVASGGGGDTPPTCAPCQVEHPLPPPPTFPFCPAAGDPAQVFSIVNGPGIYGYTPPSATPDALLPLLPATMSGDLNALMLDPVRNRLLMIQRSSGTESTLWAYDAANGGWYVAAGPFVSPDFPRGGFAADGTGYLLSGAASPDVWTVVAQPSPSFGYTVTQIGNMTYDQTPTNLSSGDIAFDGDGRAWLAVGQDLWHLDLGTLVAVRQTRPLLNGSPSTINWAGIAFASNGALILANNSSPSAYYQYDPATGVITHLADTTANSSRDLASCAFPIQALPELSVVKTLDQVNGAAPGPFVHPGDVLRYAITISNTGGAVATLYPGDVVETLPTHTTAVAAGNDFTCTGSTCPNSAAVNVTAGGSTTLYFVVQLDSPLPTAQISNAVAIPGEVDCSVAPNDCGEETPVGPRLTMSKTLQSGGPLAAPGGSLVYAITLTNLSGVPASVPAGAIGETVPVATTHAGADSFSCAGVAAGSACSNSAAVSVPANGSTVLTFAVSVDDPIAAGVLSIQNTALPPPDVACPSCSVTTPTAPNVTLVKALTAESGAQPGIAEPGETLTYTITLGNSGGTAFTNYDFAEHVPASATLTAVSGAGVTAGCTLPLAGVATCPVTVASVPANGTTTVSVSFQIAAPVPAGTAAIVNLVDGGDTTCPQAGNVCSVTTPTAPSVTLVKALTAESGSQAGVAEPGETLTYTITLSNSGGTPFANYDFVENVPAGASLVSVAGAGVTSGCALPLTGPAGCAVTVAAVPANGSTTVTVAFALDDPLPTGAAAIVNLVNGGDTTCPQPGNVCSVTTPTAPRVTLVKALTAESGSQAGVAEPGETLTYTITLSNSGGSAFANYDFVEHVPAGATLTAVTGAGVTGGCALPLAGAGTCNVTVASVPANGSTTATIVFTLDAPLPSGTASIVNLVDGGDTTCPQTGNVCSVTTPTAPSVILVKALTAESGSQAGVAEPGETLTYTITLSNDGGTAFTDYDFVEHVPAGATLSSVTGTGVSSACTLPLAGANTCAVTVASVPANGSTTATIVFTLDDPLPSGTASIVNLVDGGDTTCPQTGNVCSVTTPTEPRITLVKALTTENGSLSGVAEPGETLTYTITLSNDGGTAFTDYDFVEHVPAGATLSSVTGTGVTAGCTLPLAGAGTCAITVASVPANGSTTVDIVFTLDDPLPSGTASIVNLVDGGDTTCPQTGNVCSVTTPTEPRITLVKALTTESGSQAGVAEPGETLTYTITLSNDGGTAFTDYDFVEHVPAGATLSSVTGTGVSSACTLPLAGANTCAVTVASVPANGSTTVTVVFALDDPLPSGTASIVNLVDGGDTSCPQTGNVCSVTTPTQGRVTIAKTVADASGNGIAEPGETLTWTITLNNDGGSAVGGFGLTDPLDPNTSFVSASNGGTHAAGTVTWTGLTVPAQVGSTPGTLVLTVVTTVSSPIPEGVREIANLAYETGGTPPDCSSTPLPANCASIPTAARLSVAKALSGESQTADGIAEPGEQLTYTITVRNHGGTLADDVIVNEIVPLHTTFVSGTPGWSCAAGAPAGTACVSTVDVPAADAGGTPGVATLTFTVEVADPLPAGVQQIANAVAIDDGVPPDCAANPTHPQCVVTPTINLNLVKSVESITATGPGTYWVAYRIDLANTGGSPVTYTLTDTPDFTPNGVTVTGSGIAATSSGVLNPALPGGAFAVVNGSPVQLSANGVTLAVGASHSYTVRIPIAVAAGSLADAACTGAPGHGLYNRASVAGSFSSESSACAPVSGEQPLIRLVKTVRLGIDANGDHYGNVGDVLHYTFRISNPGTLPLSAIDLIDPRVTDLQCDATTAYGELLRILRGDELFLGPFEHTLGGSLVPGDSITCGATYTITAQDVLNRRVVNTATTHGAATDGQVVTSTSTAIYTNIR